LRAITVVFVFSRASALSTRSVRLRGLKAGAIGNAAADQLQLDVFGEVMDALHQARVGGDLYLAVGSVMPITDLVERCKVVPRFGPIRPSTPLLSQATEACRSPEVFQK
jgi:hypothetical protein